MQLELETETSLSPEQVVAALTDFTERRPKMWTGISPQLYEVYSVSETNADVREGTKQGPLNVWARENYDWSTPNTVIWTVKESNFCHGRQLRQGRDPTPGRRRERHHVHVGPDADLSRRPVHLRGDEGHARQRDREVDEERPRELRA